MTNSIQKGKDGERELAKVLTALLGVKCRRGQQHTGLEGEDVVGIDGIHIECKRDERLNLKKAYEQAQRDAKDDDIPVVCHRKNREPWMITFALSELVDLVQVIQDAQQLGADWYTNEMYRGEKTDIDKDST